MSLSEEFAKSAISKITLEKELKKLHNTILLRNILKYIYNNKTYLKKRYFTTLYSQTF